jgi:hypothetical protein
VLNLSQQLSQLGESSGRTAPVSDLSEQENTYCVCSPQGRAQQMLRNPSISACRPYGITCTTSIKSCAPITDWKRSCTRSIES